MKKLLAFFTMISLLASYPVFSADLGVDVEIKEPEDGAVFHQRNVSIYCIATSCCGDRLVYWEWKWIWNNGSYNESGKLDFLTKYEFYINISLYPDWNIIEVKVKSNRGLVASDEITIYYDGPLAIADGPYEGKAGEEIKFYGSAYGGKKPYTWKWDFGDGTYAYEKNASHTYTQEGNYKVKLTVTDSRGYSDTAYTYAMIGIDDLPPSVKIISPKNGIYVKGKRIFPATMPIIIGDVTVEAEAKDNDTHITSVAFYFDEKFMKNDSMPPYTWLMDVNETGIHEIKVIAYDVAMNSAIDMKKILIIGAKK